MSLPRRGSLLAVASLSLSLACAAPQPTASAGVQNTCPEPVPAHALEEAPTPCDAVSAMRHVAAAIAACAPDDTGSIQVAIVFRGSGEFASARVTNAPYAETTIARCVERAAAAARIAPFSRPTFTVNFPFRAGGARH